MQRIQQYHEYTTHEYGRASVHGVAIQISEFLEAHPNMRVASVTSLGEASVLVVYDEVTPSAKAACSSELEKVSDHPAVTVADDTTAVDLSTCYGKDDGTILVSDTADVTDTTDATYLSFGGEPISVAQAGAIMKHLVNGDIIDDPRDPKDREVVDHSGATKKNAADWIAHHRAVLEKKKKAILEKEQ